MTEKLDMKTSTKTAILFNIKQSKLSSPNKTHETREMGRQINAVICSGISINANFFVDLRRSKTVNSNNNNDIFTVISSTHKVFASGDVHVKINEDVSGKCIFVFQGFSSNQSVNSNIMEALICADALKIAGAKKVVLVAPYLPYSRQDKPANGESLSFALMSKAMKASGIDSIITYDCHSQLAINQSAIPIINISASILFKESIKSVTKYIKNDSIEKILVISTDEGGRDRANNIAKILTEDIHKGESLGGNSKAMNPESIKSESDKLIDVIVLEKNRDLAIGGNLNIDHEYSAKYSDELKINNKIAIIVDDIVDGGFSLENAAAIAKKIGANKVIAMISNCLMSELKGCNNLHKLQSVDEIFAASCILTDEKIDNINGKLSIIESYSSILDAIYFEIS